jgi:hypothetical protein
MNSIENWIAENPLLALAGFLLVVVALGILAGAWIASKILRPRLEPQISQISADSNAEAFMDPFPAPLIVVRARAPMEKERRAAVFDQWHKDEKTRIAMEDELDDLIAEAEYQASMSQLAESHGATSHALGGVAWLMRVREIMEGGVAAPARRPQPPAEVLRKGA